MRPASSALPALLLALGCTQSTQPFSATTAEAPATSESGGTAAELPGQAPIALGGAAGAATGGAALGGAPSPVVEVGASVLERSANPARTSHYVVPALTRAAVSKFFFDRSFSAPFEGEVLASPLYFQEGEPGQGLVLVATNQHVHAIDAGSGQVRWSKQLGTIASTGVIDPSSRTFYVAEAVGPIHALSLSDGSEREGYPLATATLLPDFDADSHYQRAALSLVAGHLYVAYDVADALAHGTVLAIDVKTRTLLQAWTSQAAGAGVSAPAGMASDGDGVLLATGHASAEPVDSQMVLRFRATSRGAEPFFPPNRQQLNETGADLGASGPLLLEMQGSKYVAQVSGDGHLYLLDPAKLGGTGGQVLDFQVAQGTAAIRTAPTTYRTAQGTYVAFTAATGVTCPIGSPAPPGGNTGQVVAAVRLTPGTPPQAELAWCYYLLSGQGAPASTTSNASDDATVWVMEDVKLIGLDGDTGHATFDGGHDISGIPFEQRTCPGVAPYTSPIPVGDRLMIAANGRLCAWAQQ